MEIGKRIYKIRPVGDSYYVAIPKVLVREIMLKLGVYIDVLSVSDDEIVLKLRAARDAVEKHVEDNKESGENTQELRAANGVR